MVWAVSRGKLPGGVPADALEVLMAVEVGRHGEGVEVGVAGEGGADGLEEGAGGDAPMVGGTEEPGAGVEAGGGECDEGAVVGFGAEDPALVVAGEAGGVEDDAVEAPLLFGEALEPVEGVALDEVVLFGIDLVEAHVVAGPVEAGLGEIEGGGGGAGRGGGDGEGPGVGEGVEDGVTGFAPLADALAVVALVEEDALGVAGLEADLEAEAVLADDEGFVLFRAAEVLGGFLFVLIEFLPIDRFAGFVEPGAEGRGDVGGLGGEDPAVGERFEVDSREGIACAVDEAVGVGIAKVQLHSCLESSVEEVDHERIAMTAAASIMRHSMSEWKTRLAQAVASGEVLESSQENVERLLSGTANPLAAAVVEELVAGQEWAEINDRFYKTMEFGTGGLRGRTIGKVVTKAEQGAGGPLGRPEHPCVGTASMNYYNLGRAMQGFITYVKRNIAALGEERKPVFVFAHDTRHFSADFAAYCCKVLVELGCEAYLFEGPRSTPELSFAVRELKADAGVVLTASHNPPHDNGFKAYFSDGAQIVEPHASGIIEEVNALESEAYEPLAETEQGALTKLGQTMDRKYMDRLRKLLLRPELLEGRSAKVAYTNLHGTGGHIVVPMLEELGFEVLTVPEQDVQDGRFPTVASPNPENAAALQMAVDLAEKEQASVVIGTDPDCDRMGVVVRNGKGTMQLLTGNQIGTLLGWYRIKTLVEQGIITESNRSRAVVVKTFVTTDFQAAITEKFGIGVLNTLTGFKYIGEKLKKYEDAIPADKKGDYRSLTEEESRALRLEYSRFFVFGSEESYGYLGGDFVRDKDANGAAVMIAELAAHAMSEGKTIADLLDDLFVEFGVFQEHGVSLVMEGADGAGKIAALAKSYSVSPPKEVDGVAVAKSQDFLTQDIYDEEGDLIPKQGMINITLVDGRRFAVRASGTEPKIKYYLFGNGEPGPADLEAEIARVKGSLESMWVWLEKDARERMG